MEEHFVVNQLIRPALYYEINELQVLKYVCCYVYFFIHDYISGADECEAGTKECCADSQCMKRVSSA